MSRPLLLLAASMFACGDSPAADPIDASLPPDAMVDAIAPRDVGYSPNDARVLPPTNDGSGTVVDMNQRKIIAVDFLDPAENPADPTRRRPLRSTPNALPAGTPAICTATSASKAKVENVVNEPRNPTMRISPCSSDRTPRLVTRPATMPKRRHPRALTREVL